MTPMTKHTTTTILLFTASLLSPTCGWTMLGDPKTTLEVFERLDQQQERKAQQLEAPAREWVDMAWKAAGRTRNDAVRSQQAAYWAEKLISEQDRAREWADRAQQAATRTQRLAEAVREWVRMVREEERERAEKYQGAKGRYKTVVAVWREAMEIVQQAADQARDDAALAQQAAEWARKVIAR